jgi:D-alanyl-D-alanine carboxypeptidase
VSVRRLGTHTAAAIAGSIVGALLVFGVEGLTSTPEPVHTYTRPVPPRLAEPLPVVQVTGRPKGLVLAWSPGDLPPEAEAAVESIRGVRRATMVAAGLDWIERTVDESGNIVDKPGHNMVIPFEVAAVRPAEYARFVAPGERAAVLALKRGEALLAETAAELRRARPGMVIRLRDRRLVVAGIVSDVTTNGYEAIVRAPAPSEWGRVDHFLLVHNRSARRAVIERRLARLLAPGERLQVRIGNEQPFLRYGDAVHPQMIIKQNFGEFAARPRSDGFIDIDPRWVRANIRRAEVPLLGAITCHRAIFPQLRRALREVDDQGLAHFVTVNSGCYSPRFIRADPDSRLSHHAWGIAVDMNAPDNPFGTEPNLARRVVRVFETWGFTWGGRWIIPDGMHFEWQRWP